MTLYVHVNESNKPWIDMVSTEKKDGYVAVSGLMDYQTLALLNFPDKCFLDDLGIVHAPNDLPISEQEKNEELVKSMQSKVDILNDNVKLLTNERDSVKNDNNNLTNQVKLMQSQIMSYTKELAIVNAKLQSKSTQPTQPTQPAQAQSQQGGDN